MNKVLKVGIATVQEQRARSLAIAAGTRTRDADEPNVWLPLSPQWLGFCLVKTWLCLKWPVTNNRTRWLPWLVIAFNLLCM